MVILIGGESHTGKTLAAQRLLEKYAYPYMSIDHLKMGLIKGYPECGFTASDNDEFIAEKLWNVLKGIIETCIENQQHIIIEGVYLPPGKLSELDNNEIIAAYILFSKEYIAHHFDKILFHENVIEKRKYPELRDREEFILSNQLLKEKCIASGMPYFEIEKDYDKDMLQLYKYIDNRMQEKDNP